ncbi:MAG: hypothetical protein WC794_02915 [Candidatus Doudnabacteria bacterium]|jgi:hypothetical protein
MSERSERRGIDTNDFQVGNIITCPSDLTSQKSGEPGIKWEIVSIDSKRIIHAKIVEGQNPSEFYPKTIEIPSQAYSGWKKVE